jgi:glycosyltransferase involved in cell wall biosynthesis
MRLVFAISTMEMGGAQRVGAALVHHWVASGHDATVVVTYSGTTNCHYALPPEVALVKLSEETGGVLRWLPSRLARVLALRRLFARIHPDAVVSFLPDANLAAILASIGQSQALIVSERSYPPRDQVPLLYRALRRLVYPWATRVVFPTVAGSNWLRSNLPRAAGETIPNAVSPILARVPPLAAVADLIDPGDRIILTVGRLVPGKGHDDLLRAYALICRQFSRWKLVIAGDGPNEMALRTLAEQFGIGERVIFTGTIGNIGDWYERADVFVLASHYEGFPNVLVEAMSHGCASVSYDCETGPREIIDDGDNGLLVSRVGDVEGLAAAIRRLLEDDAFRAKLSQAALGVRERFAMSRIMAQWDALIHRTASERRT